MYITFDFKHIILPYVDRLSVSDLSSMIRRDERTPFTNLLELGIQDMPYPYNLLVNS